MVTSLYRQRRLREPVKEFAQAKELVPPEEFEEFPIQESEGSRKGCFYEAANGEEIQNERGKSCEIPHRGISEPNLCISGGEGHKTVVVSGASD